MYIEKAELHDIEMITALITEVARHDIFPGLSKTGQNHFLSVIANEVRLSVLGAEYQSVKLVIDDQLLGFAAIKNGRYVTKVFVDRRIQGCGIGRKLLDHLLSYATSPIIELKAFPPAVPFYLANGFKKTGEEDEINGIRFIPMQRQLDDICILEDAGVLRESLSGSD